MEGRARRYYERNLKNKIFLAWSDWACQEALDGINKDQKAREYYIWYVCKFQYYILFRISPYVNSAEPDFIY